MSKYTTAVVAGFVAAAVMTLLMMFVFEGVTPYIYGICTGAFVAYIFANLAGNRKVPTADPAQKEAALALKPPAGKSLLVVYREGFVAKLAGLNIAVDGEEFAPLTAPKFTIVALPPGVHTLACGFGGFAGPQTKLGTYDFAVDEGAVATVGIAVRMGAVQGSMGFTTIQDVKDVRAKVSRMPMVMASPAEI